MLLYELKQTFPALTSLAPVGCCWHPRLIAVCSACHWVQTVNSQFLLFSGMFWLWKMWLQWSKRAKGKSALSISFSCLFKPQGIKSPGSQVSRCIQWRLALPGSIAKARPRAGSSISVSVAAEGRRAQGRGQVNALTLEWSPQPNGAVPSLLPHPVGC